jgi:hypothetical protein
VELPVVPTFRVRDQAEGGNQLQGPWMHAT